MQGCKASAMCSEQSFLLESAYENLSLHRFHCSGRAFCLSLQSGFFFLSPSKPFLNQNQEKGNHLGFSHVTQPTESPTGDTPIPLSECTAYGNLQGEDVFRSTVGDGHVLLSSSARNFKGARGGVGVGAVIPFNITKLHLWR